MANEIDANYRKFLSLTFLCFLVFLQTGKGLSLFLQYKTEPNCLFILKDSIGK
jgi:hypothetical protein